MSLPLGDELVHLLGSDVLRAFFGALFYARVISVPWLGDLDHKLIWPDFDARWPASGPAGIVEPFTPMGAWRIPAINTLLLLASGVTLTIAHQALRANHRRRLIFWLFAHDRCWASRSSASRSTSTRTPTAT